MKRILCLLMGTGVLAGMLALSATAQSLGDLAREARKSKKPSSLATKVYTNDDLPAATTIGVQGAPAATGAAADTGKATKKSEEVSADERKKKEDEWRAKFADQKKNISQLERELDVLQREYKLRAAAYYGDAGNQLRDPKKWTQEEAKFRDDIANKQKELQAAKDKLEDMREQLRRDGFPSSVAD